MKKQEYTLTLRVPKETIKKLRTIAEYNYCSVSDIVRDVLASETPEEEQEHVFLDEERWKKAVKARDGQRCVVCGSPNDLDVYPVQPLDNGGEPTISNGETLCFDCHSRRQPYEPLIKNGHVLHERIPRCWMKKYAESKEQGRLFWERYLACYLTKRKRTLSPIVEWYMETFLRDIPEEVIVRTLVEICPSPSIIAEFPSRHHTSPDEEFPPPPLVW